MPRRRTLLDSITSSATKARNCSYQLFLTIFQNKTGKKTALKKYFHARMKPQNLVLNATHRPLFQRLPPQSPPNTTGAVTPYDMCSPTQQPVQPCPTTCAAPSDPTGGRQKRTPLRPSAPKGKAWHVPYFSFHLFLLPL